MEHWVYANEYVSLELERLSQERGEVAELHSNPNFNPNPNPNPHPNPNSHPNPNPLP